jgi:hypothetical protein
LSAILFGTEAKPLGLRRLSAKRTATLEQLSGECSAQAATRC